MSTKRKALPLGIAFAALCVTSAGAYAATAFAETPLNVRSGPGPGYRVVDVLQRGEEVEVEYCQGIWCAISKPGPDGWVSANYLSRGGGYNDDNFYDDDADFYDDGDYYDDGDFYDDDYYVQRRIIRTYPIYRQYDPGFSACIGGPNAKFCLYD